MTRFLVTSDPQIGAHPDFGRNPGDRLADDERVWERVLAMAVEYRVDAVLHGGDLFQHRRPTPAHLMAFQRPLLAFLAEHDIPVLAINGNHEVESPALPSSLELFEPVIDVHTEPGVWTPGGNLYRPGEVAVCTLPWVPMAKLVAARNGGDREDTHAIAARLLVEVARELRGRVDGPAVLLAHWHVDGATTVTGKGASEIFREPLLDVGDLEELGFDAILLGHNHMPQVLAPNIVHIGSPQPIDFGEANVEHGVWLLDIDEKMRPNHVHADFLPVESRPFVTLDYTVTETGVASNDLGIYLDGGLIDAVVRVRYTASEEQARRIDHAEITKALYDAGVHRVYAIQPDIIRAGRARVDAVDENIAPLAAVQAWCDTQEISSGDWTRELLDLTARYLDEVTT